MVHADSRLDLLELVLDERVLFITICMVVRKDVQRLLLLALADEETWGLGHEPDEEELEDGGNGLEEGRNTP